MTQVKRPKCWRMSCDVGEETERLENEQSFLQYNEQRSFSNLSITLLTSQHIFQPFRCFTYVTEHSPTIISLLLRHRLFTQRAVNAVQQQSSFSNISLTSRTSQLIRQPFRRFTYVTVLSPILPLHHLRHSSFSNPSVASPTSQLTLQPFFRFSYVTGSSPGEPPILSSSRAHSPTLQSLHLRHSSLSNPSFASPKSWALHLRTW